MTLLQRIRALFVPDDPKPPPGGSIRLQEALKESRASRAALHDRINQPMPGEPGRATSNPLGNLLADRGK